MPDRRRFTDREGVYCAMPTHVPADEAHIYQELRRMHCAAGKPSHNCQGRITIDRNGITLSCQRCGDARSLYPRIEDG